MKVENISINAITTAEYNPRAIGDKEYQGLKKSLSEFELVQPLIVNKREGKLILVSGHQRLAIMKELGYEEVPVIFVELSQEREKILNLTLNSTKIQGHFTQEVNALLSELSADNSTLLESLNFDFSIDAELSSMTFMMPPITHIPSADSVNKKDDVWESDIRKVERVDENMDGIPAKIIITCAQIDKDSLLIFLKGKLMETAFEGVHIA